MFNRRKIKELKYTIDFLQKSNNKQSQEILKISNSNALLRNKVASLSNSIQSKDRFIDEQIIEVEKLKAEIQNKTTEMNNQTQLINSVKTNMVEFGNFLFSRVNKKKSPCKFVVTDADLANYLDAK